MSGICLTDHERRLLAYLDQHGPTHRERVVADLASPDSKIGRRRDSALKGPMQGAIRGSNGATPLIMGRWCRRLVKAGYVRREETKGSFSTRRGGRKTLWFYQHHEITAAGRAALRVETEQRSPA